LNLLHRYLFASVLGTCLAAVGLFSFVLIVGNALKDLLGYLLAGQLEPGTFVRLILLLVPYSAAYALPMGLLAGILLVLGRLSAQGEITAMRAAGLGLGYIARPVFLIAALGVIASLAVNFEYMPRARTAYKETLAEAVRKNPLRFIVPRTFIRDFPGVVVYVGEKSGEVMRDFWVWQLDDQKRVRTFVRARSGRFDYREDSNTLVLVLTQVSVETRGGEQPEDFRRPPPVGVTEQMSVDLRLDNLFGKQTVRRKLSWMTFDELRAERARQAAQPPGAARDLAVARVDFAFNEKASTAFAVLAFALIGVPLGIRVSRSETSANLGVALGLVMAYYFLSVMAGWLDERPDLRPDLLLWFPTLLFAGIGVFLFRRVDRA
jgi:lipopolysaccharide export system permease protein